jgi:DNA-directed RNA polymerase III subunit RPC3
MTCPQAVASVLLTRGRLSFSQLVRFSSLKPGIVRAAILVLVQHNVLWHAQTEDEGEVVEMNVEECLMRLRFGKFIWWTTQIFGEAVWLLSFYEKSLGNFKSGR